MAAAKQNLIIEQKATFRRRLLYRDKFKKPILLTGYSAHMTVRAADGTMILDLTTENGRITLSVLPGSIDLKISATDTAALTFTTALYDLTLIAPDGTVTRLMEGKVTLSPGQT